MGQLLVDEAKLRALLGNGRGRPRKVQQAEEEDVEMRALIEEFANKLRELIEKEATKRARAMVRETLGLRGPGRPRKE